MNKWVEKLYAWGLLIIFAGVIIHAPLTVWLGTILPDYALVIKSWKEILLFLLIPAALWLVTKKHLWREFAKDWIFRLIIGYAALHIILIVPFWQGPEQTLAGIGIDLRYILFFALVYTLVRVTPSYKKIMLNVAVGGAAVVVGFATLQLALPPDVLTHIGYSDQTIKPYQMVDENPDYIRVNSTLRGPNPLGAYAAALLGVVAVFFMKNRRQLKSNKIWLVRFLVICGGIALFVSYSRSALVAAIIGVVLAILLIQNRRAIPFSSGAIAAGIGFILVGSFIIAPNNSFIQNVILHDNETTGASVTSNEDHVTSLQVGISRLLNQPLGAGIGSTGSASLLSANGHIVENQYLFIAHETGWLGLALFSCIFILTMVRLFHLKRDWLALGVFVSGVTLGLIGLLLPVWADDTVSIVWWGLAGLALGGIHGKERQSK